LGMQLISRNLQKIAGGNVSRMLGKMSGNRLAGIGMGAGAAVILESSSATTVILLGLVNSGIVNLLQATLIIMGANVGTTFTVLLFSLGYLPVGELLAFCALIGASVVMGSKKEKNRTIGWIIAGFGLIFIGLDTMGNSVEFLKESKRLADLILSVENPFLLVLIGAFSSGIVQSSTAITGISITFAEAGLMRAGAAFYIILGSNVGTCILAILASLGANLNAKRTALIHLLFNVIGVIVFMPFLIIWGDTVCINALKKISPAALIAYFHVVFNLTTTIILFPFVKTLANLSVILLPDKLPQKSPPSAST